MTDILMYKVPTRSNCSASRRLCGSAACCYNSNAATCSSRSRIPDVQPRALCLRILSEIHSRSYGNEIKVHPERESQGGLAAVICPVNRYRAVIAELAPAFARESYNRLVHPNRGVSLSTSHVLRGLAITRHKAASPLSRRAALTSVYMPTSSVKWDESNSDIGLLGSRHG